MDRLPEGRERPLDGSPIEGSEEDAPSARRPRHDLLPKEWDDDQGHEGRAVLALTLWLHLFLLITTLILGRSVTSAFFLDYYDARGLALVSIILGLSVALLASVLERLSVRWSASALSLGLLGGLALVALLGGFCLPIWGNSFRGVIHVLMETLAFLCTVRFWARANAALTLDEARRWYPWIATGGLAGSVAGGLLTRCSADWPIGSPLLLLVALTPLQALALLAFEQFEQIAQARHARSAGFRKEADVWNWDRSTRSVSVPLDPPTPDGDSFEPLEGPVRASSLMTSLGLLSLVGVFCTTLIDFYFKMMAHSRHRDDLAGLTAFFGDFYLVVGLGTLGIQLLVTPILLRHSTAFMGLFVTPIILGLVGLANGLAPSMGLASLFKIADSGLQHGLYRSCQEMLYTPLPTRWARPWRHRAEGIFGRYGLLLAGGLLWLLAARVDRVGPSTLLPVILLTIVLWVIVLRRLQVAYRRQAMIAWAAREPSPSPRRKGAA